jgi:hypothetical protein
VVRNLHDVLARLLQKPLLTEIFKTFLNSTHIHNGGATGNVGASLFETLSEIFEPELKCPYQKTHNCRFFVR